MYSVILEVICAVVGCSTAVYLIYAGYQGGLERQPGWVYLVVGFTLISFGLVIGVTDNFESLSPLIVVGQTDVQAFLEKVAGYSLGFIFVTIGFVKWFSHIKALREQSSAKANSFQKPSTCTVNCESENGFSVNCYADDDRVAVIASLESVFEEVKTLDGIVPICSFCKKIRNHSGSWSYIECYLQEKTSTRVSHGVCPDCAHEHYPEVKRGQRGQ